MSIRLMGAFVVGACIVFMALSVLADIAPFPKSYVPRTKKPAAPGKFSPQAWRQAADPKSSDWSREALLTQFVEEYKLDGMEHDKVISLLGEPARSYEFYPGGDRPSRRDTYCLSAKDEESFVLDYEAQ